MGRSETTAEAEACDYSGAASLLDLLTEPQFIAFVEAFGGTRVYLPKVMKANHPIAQITGVEAAEALTEAMGCGYIHVPIARELRARHYRAAGLSYERIARKLGMSRTGIERMFKRLNNAP